MAELRRSSNIRESLPGTMVSMRSPTRPHSALNSAGDRREAERVERICLALAAKPVHPTLANTERAIIRGRRMLLRKSDFLRRRQENLSVVRTEPRLHSS